MDKKRTVTMKGNPVTLVGNELKVGDKAPAFSVLDGSMQPVTLETYKGKVKVISVTPSLDTPVCDLQLRRFNSEIAALGDNYAVINISMDLPFAIKRFCVTAEISNAVAASDHREAAFGTAYGVLIKELRLLARAVFVIDENDKVTYVEYIPEVTSSPDFDKLLAALKN
jgi:thiol peroxidase